MTTDSVGKLKFWTVIRLKCYNPKNPNRRNAIWTEETPERRWRCYEYDELLKRDKANLDIFWLRDETLEESDNLPAPKSSPRKSSTTCKRPWNSSRILRRS